jgi:LysR family transcriptional activator of dmlA
VGILDDTAIFAAVVQQGGFSHAARHLNLSNGLISRRIAQLESGLGVTLITRTTRQLHLTPEGELFWQHAQRIQQELDSAISLIQSSVKKPKGTIRISAPLYFGREYLTPIIIKFMNDFKDIKVDLMLSNTRLDLVKEQFDVVIRGAGYVDDVSLQDSSLQMKIFLKEKIGLYASPAYLLKQGEPHNCDDLSKHSIINYTDNTRVAEQEKWAYKFDGKSGMVVLNPKFNVNDIGSGLIACIAGYGIGKFTELNVKNAVQKQQLCAVMKKYDWGEYHLHAIYPHQQALPKRTRLLLDFVHAHTRHFLEKISE